MNNIYLIGMMGSGKTVVGKGLAKSLKRPFCDIDERIVASEGESINALFQKKGEPYFRLREKEILDEIAKNEGYVIATGGGVVLDDVNISRMRETGTIVYLRATEECLIARLRKATDRPLLKGAELEARVRAIFSARCVRYEQAADIVVDVSKKNIAPICDEIAIKMIK